MKDFIIPKKFNLMGDKWRVKYRKNFNIKRGLLGECASPERIITLDKGLEGQQLIDVFMHEVFHAILFSLDENELNANERRVDNISKLLGQFILQI
jgi:hypothetical protein